MRLNYYSGLFWRLYKSLIHKNSNLSGQGECFLAYMTFCSLVFPQKGKKKIFKESIMNDQFFRHMIPLYCILQVFYFLSCSSSFILYLLLSFIPKFPAANISLGGFWKVEFIMKCSFPSLCIETMPIQKFGCISEK